MAYTSISIRLVLCAYFVVSLCLFFPHSTTALHSGGEEDDSGNVHVPVPAPAQHGTVVKKDQRWSLVTAEYGEISSVKVSDGRDGFYHLQFITMEPNSLFLPVHLHSDMVFYVHSGSGTLSWIDLEDDDDKLRQVELTTGDVYRLRTGSFFYLQSSLDSDRRKLRINAIFSDSKEELRERQSSGAYSSVRDLVLGFDNKVLQAALNVDEEVIQELRKGEKQPMIVHGVAKVNDLTNVHYRILKTFIGRMKMSAIIDVNKKDKKDKDKPYNILEADHDVENCNGWSLIVTSKQFDALKDSDFSIFLVNLTKGAMMGPHWNPMTAEIAVVLSGRGMVHVVCPSTTNETECKNSRFRVEEGDVFVVPRYHPMAQISFNNRSFVFMGFTTTTKNNHPQFLAGSASVFQILDKDILAISLGVSNTTVDEIRAAQRDAIILECTSCAEEEERLMEEEIQREKEEKRKKEEEEVEAAAAAREKEEEEEARRRQQEEEAAKQQEEEAAKKEEEAVRKQKEKEDRKWQEEEAKRKREQEEEAAKKQEEEAAKRQQEEEETIRKKEEEEAARRQEGRKQHEQEKEAARQQKEEKEEEEAARGQEARKEQEQEKEAARRQKEKEKEEEAARRQEDRKEREQEKEAARQQKEEARQQLEKKDAARQQEDKEAAKQKEEEEARKRQQRQKEEETARGGGGSGGGGRQWGGEGEAASREEGEMERREREAEAAGRGGGGHGGGRYEE